MIDGIRFPFSTFVATRVMIRRRNQTQDAPLSLKVEMQYVSSEKDKQQSWSDEGKNLLWPTIAILVDAIICTAILLRVPYTEIDYSTYMQQVTLFESGERDYYQIYGDTGPLVYPAGFLYFFSGMKWLVGGSIRSAQVIFAAMYLATAFISMRNGMKSKLSFWALCLVILSRRTHSIFLLRLFNDGVCALLGQLSVMFFVDKRWTMGCVFLSLAVSMKMSALLFAPGVAFLLFQNLSFWSAIGHILLVCGGIQLLLGLPFLTTHPIAYIHKAFELTRVFELKWSVNYQFLTNEVFTSKSVSILLLFFTMGLYVLFYRKVWLRRKNDILLILLSSNFIGIVASRTIHFQFYAWYSFTLPALALLGNWTKTKLDWLIRIVVLVGIEYVYNYPGVGDNPSTPTSSIVWHILHHVLLWGLVKTV